MLVAVKRGFCDAAGPRLLLDLGAIEISTCLVSITGMRRYVPVTFILILLFSTVASATESINVGCVSPKLFCDAETQQCHWLTAEGRVTTVALSFSGSGPNYEVFQGSQSGLELEGQKFTLKVYQRRQGGEFFNYVTVDMPIEDMVITGSGQNLALARYWKPEAKKGVGIRCTTEIQESDKN